ncbi:MAG: recombinase family protein [Chloroflexota bacterium]|nr:recombinase family protein [Chloroflexota bacterium]
MRAVIYCRVSTSKQEDNFSLGAQEQDCREYASERGWEVSEVYREVESGADLWERPQLTRLRNSMNRGEFQILLVWKLDRLSRDQNHTGLLFSEAERAGVLVDSATEDLSDDSFQGKLYRTLASMFNEAEREKIRARTHQGRVAKAKEGRVHPHGACLFGYSYDPGTQSYRPVEGRAKTVRRIFAWYIDGVSTSEIVKRLNLEAVPTDSDAEHGWTRTKVSTLVTREEYTGQGWANRYYGRKEAKKKGTKTRPESEWVPISYPAIIDPQTFERAQARRKSNKNFAVYNRTGAEYLLVGLLRCAETGKMFEANTTTVQRGAKVYRYYRCRACEMYPQTFDCHPKMYRADRIDAEVWEAVKVAIKSPHMMFNQLGKIFDKDAPEREGLEQRLVSVDTKLGELEMERRQYVRFAAQGKISETEMDMELSRIREESEYWQEQKAQLEAMLAQQTAEQAQLAALYEWFETLEDIETWDFETRRERVRQLVREVTVDRDGELLMSLRMPESLLTRSGSS